MNAGVVASAVLAENSKLCQTGIREPILHAHCGGATQLSKGYFGWLRTKRQRTPLPYPPYGVWTRMVA